MITTETETTESPIKLPKAGKRGAPSRFQNEPSPLLAAARLARGAAGPLPVYTLSGIDPDKPVACPVDASVSEDKTVDAPEVKEMRIDGDCPPVVYRIAEGKETTPEDSATAAALHNLASKPSRSPEATAPVKEEVEDVETASPVASWCDVANEASECGEALSAVELLTRKYAYADEIGILFRFRQRAIHSLQGKIRGLPPATSLQKAMAAAGVTWLAARLEACGGDEWCDQIYNLVSEVETEPTPTTPAPAPAPAMDNVLEEIRAHNLREDRRDRIREIERDMIKVA